MGVYYKHMTEYECRKQRRRLAIITNRHTYIELFTPCDGKSVPQINGKGVSVS